MIGGVVAAGEEAVEVDADRTRWCCIVVGGNLTRAGRCSFEVLEKGRLRVDWKSGRGGWDELTMQHGPKWEALGFRLASVERR